MRRVRFALPVLAPVLAALVLAGCTSSASRSPSSQPVETIYSTTTQTRSATTGTTTAPASGAPTPVGSGPTTAAAATSCPLVSTAAAVDKGGMRLARITVLKSGGKVVGCRFYGQQQPSSDCPQSCLDGEHLPPANQPAIQIATTRYRTAVDAHNAIVLVARKGTQPQQVDIGIDNIGVCFQNDFYPADGGKDWACTFSIDKVAVLVQTVASESGNARGVSVAVAANL